MRKLRVLLVGAMLGISMGAVAAPAHACMSEVCDAVNHVCSRTITKGYDCVG
ncbi:MAG: hypothetical protein M3273_02325 [Actinomycetota bacterium]|nr:hypothetical protein [Actinomycetota bacterium]